MRMRLVVWTEPAPPRGDGSAQPTAWPPSCRSRRVSVGGFGEPRRQLVEHRWTSVDLGGGDEGLGLGDEHRWELEGDPAVAGTVRRRVGDRQVGAVAGQDARLVAQDPRAVGHDDVRLADRPAAVVGGLDGRERQAPAVEGHQRGELGRVGHGRLGDGEIRVLEQRRREVAELVVAQVALGERGQAGGVAERRQVAALDELDVQVAAMDRPVPVGDEDPRRPQAGEVDGRALRRQRQGGDLQRQPVGSGRLLDEVAEVLRRDVRVVVAVGERPHSRTAVEVVAGGELRPPQLADPGRRDRPRARRRTGRSTAATGSAPPGSRSTSCPSPVRPDRRLRAGSAPSARGSTLRAYPAMLSRLPTVKSVPAGISTLMRDGLARRWGWASPGGISAAGIVASAVCCEPNETT